MGIDLTGLTHVGDVITAQTLMQLNAAILVDLLSVPGGPEASVSGAPQNLVQWLVSGKCAYPLPDRSDLAQACSLAATGRCLSCPGSSAASPSRWATSPVRYAPSASNNNGSPMSLTGSPAWSALMKASLAWVAPPLSAATDIPATVVVGVGIAGVEVVVGVITELNTSCTACLVLVDECQSAFPLYMCHGRGPGPACSQWSVTPVLHVPKSLGASVLPEPPSEGTPASRICRPKHCAGAGGRKAHLTLCSVDAQSEGASRCLRLRIAARVPQNWWGGARSPQRHRL